MPTQPTVTVTITKPDGTTATPTATKVETAPASTSQHTWHVGDQWNIYGTITDPNTSPEEVVGIYKVTQSLTLAGPWHAAWTTTGSYEAARPVSIRVLEN